jgi:hypothetical protein
MHTTLRRFAALAVPPATVAAAVAAGHSAGIISFGPPPEVDPRKSPSPPMPPPVTGGVRAEGVEAVVNYQANSVRSISTKPGSVELDGCDWCPQRVLVENGRRRAYDLDVNGFALWRDARPAATTDFYDEGAVTAEYYGACEEFVRRVTGARLVAAFDHNVRCARGKAQGQRLRGGGARVEAPAALVHNDYSAPSAARRLRMLAQPPTFLKSALQARLGGAPLLSAPLVDECLEGKRRFAFVNVWRPIVPVSRHPLGCIDAQSVTHDELVPFIVHHADDARTSAGTQHAPSEPGGIYFAQHRPAHRWVYYPRMSSDEVRRGVHRGATARAP